MAKSKSRHDLNARKAAKTRKQKRYFTGIPCPRGHIAERHTSNGACVVCTRDNVHRWQRNNPEWVSAFEKKRYARNPEAKRQRSRQWRKNNPDKVNQWQKLNPQKARAWRDENIDKIRSSTRNRRARQREIGGKHSADDIQNILRYQKGKCAFAVYKFGWCTGTLTRFHVDHITPLFKGGTNDAANLQALCPACNLRKGFKYQHEFLGEHGIML